ncbi:MAG: class I SAM-dependent methyltransferase [Bacteroidetes bacterium]|nr:class I SAM-dependent methyltransferase [Bacteroidota bacterium]MBS1540179.1 class I SAM-dependent methyltransferase [Bacteroidota bacterium]
MKPNDFDRVAFIYDRLVRLVFGKTIVRAQLYFLHLIPEEANVLILGGGTGWLLKELILAKPQATVWYIDASAKMIARAKEKTENCQQIYFIQGTENDIPAAIQFNAVITHFYLDLFSEETLPPVILKIKNHLSANAIWLATDFVKKAWWHKVLLKMMHLFFRFTSNLQTTMLPDWSEMLQKHGGKKYGSNFFYGRFIEAAWYRF